CTRDCSSTHCSSAYNRFNVW
nr:immunoglobulin heavy chain junction region [Macaca mulatta]MOV51625.1 immunoglobulin heavy chain junction region [Macaca mulatta]MOV51745.1 immunoglobulin heavy chain junction region [Macaca mulatta]MOV52831.1 immunoglobulin heavy chain junction region [Macaca mulatta]MOV53062.1 immunoglobulin heavy chain junction region [Macaca mulatta]